MGQTDRPGGRGLWIALLVGVSLLGPGTATMIHPALPDAASEFAVSYGDIQWAVSLHMFGIAASLILVGPLADRFGRRRVLLGGLVLFVLGSTVAFLAGSLAVLILGRMVQAIGNGTAVVIPRVLVRDTMSGNEGARVMAMLVGATAISQAFGPVLGGFLTAYDGWRLVLGASAGLGLLALACVWCSCAETLAARSSAAITPAGLWRQYRGLFASRSFLAHCAIFAGSGAGFAAILIYAPKRCIIELGLAPDAYGLVVLLGASGFFFGNMASMSTVKKIGFGQLIVAGAWLSAGAIAALALFSEWASPWAVLIPMFLYSVGTGLVYPNAMHGALQVAANLAGSAGALVTSLQFLLAMALTAAVGNFAESGLEASAIMIVCFGFVAAGILATRLPPSLGHAAAQRGNAAP